MKYLAVALFSTLASCGGSGESDAAKDVAASKATWALTLKIDGMDIRIPLETMDVLLWKDEDEAKRNSSPFAIRGEGLTLIGDVPPTASPGYDEKWEKMIGQTLAIKAAGEFHRESMTSKISLQGKSDLPIIGGSLSPEKVLGKWSGSQGNKTLSGRIRLELQDGRALEGTFSVHAVTWG